MPHGVSRAASGRRRVAAVGALVSCAAALAVVVTGSLELTSSAAAGEAAATTPARDAAPRPRARAPRQVTVGWVGDMVLGSAHGLPPEEGRGLLRDVRPVLRRPDLMLGNYEGTLSEGGVSKCAGGVSSSCFAFQAPRRFAATLAWAGFDLVNLANNHAFDFGAEGRRQTVNALRGAGVKHTGGPNEVTFVRRGGTRIAVLGFAPYPWAAPLLDLARARAMVERAARRAEVVIVLMHAGAEGSDRTRTPDGPEFAYGESRGDTRAFAHTVVDAGADLVLGSGPHVVRGIESYRGRLIAYSLGNFVGYETFPTAGVLGLSGVLRVTLRGDGRVRRARWLSTLLDGPGFARPDPANASGELVAQLSRTDFGEHAFDFASEAPVSR